MQRAFQIRQLQGTQMYPPGVSFVEEGLRVCLVCAGWDGTEEVGILLFDKKNRGGLRIPFPKDARVGAVFAMLLFGYRDKSCSYLFYRGEEVFQDPFCKRAERLGTYGEPKEELARAIPEAVAYDWGQDIRVRVPGGQRILYALHVRGFTKHRTSGVKHKGTYAGVAEKIPYLRELGINTVLLMPAYEFDEVMPENALQTMEQAARAYKNAPAGNGFSSDSQKENVFLAGKANASGEQGRPPRINYWGYQKGLYYVPKSAYAHGKDAGIEFKDMVRALHRAGISVAMQFYFPPEVGAVEVLDILRHWVLEYHVDGFHLMSATLSTELIAREPLLADAMLLVEEAALIRCGRQTENLGCLNDGFLYDMRRFLKGDDNLAERFLSLMRGRRGGAGDVNSIARWDGMRLMDLVSYERKHNEGNGEDNQDGTDYNCSWNCGVEGKSRKKAIQELRLRQMKNALAFLIFAKGTPLLYSGDEFANTQEGNNNPYCQDNAVAWVKWNQTELGRELLSYTKKLISLRKAHQAIWGDAPLRSQATLPGGFPEVSYHGREAWKPDVSPASHCVGILHCGGGEGEFLYLGVNMHWQEAALGLPSLPKGRSWICLISTHRELPQIQEKGASKEISLPPRTVVLCEAKSLGGEEKKETEETNVRAKRKKRGEEGTTPPSPHRIGYERKRR